MPVRGGDDGGTAPVGRGVLELLEELGGVVVAEVARGEGGDEDDGLQERRALDVEGGDHHRRRGGARGRERLEELAAGEVGALEETEDHKACGEEDAADAEEAGVGEPAERSEQAERKEAEDVTGDDDGGTGHGDAADGGNAGRDGEVIEQITDDDGVDKAGGPRFEDNYYIWQPRSTSSDRLRPGLPAKKEISNSE